MYPNLQDLDYFQVLAEVGSVSRAAERLGISQPAMSLALKRLEHTFGVPLVERGPHGVRLTKPGDKLREGADQLVGHWQQLYAQVSQQAQCVHGHFRLGCHPAIAAYTLPHFVQPLMANYPGISLELRHGPSRHMTEDVISDRIDIALVINPIKHPDLVILELFTNKVGLWRHRDATHLCDLEHSECVLLHAPSMPQAKHITRSLRREKMLPSRVTTSEDLSVLKALALAGAGIAILPSAVVGQSSQLVAERLDLFCLDVVALIFKPQLAAGGKTIVNTIKSYKEQMAEHFGLVVY